MREQQNININEALGVRNLFAKSEVKAKLPKANNALNIFVRNS